MTLTGPPQIGSDSCVTKVTFGVGNEIGDRCQISETQFGDYSYVGNDIEIIYTDIGKFCSIASYSRINPGNHPLPRVALHHFTYRSKKYGWGEDEQELFDWRREQAVTIGHDVWIGHGAIILPGVRIGNGAVVAAGAVVSKDVAPYTIVAGVAAQPLRKRFKEEVIAGLEKLAWWHWSADLLQQRLEDFRQLSAEQFIAKFS